MKQQMIPLSRMIPPNHTAAQCRAILRNSRKYSKIGERWLFPRRQAEAVERYLAKH